MSPDMHTLTGAYAAHALPLQEEREFEAHLGECDACAQEIYELQATTARLAGGVAVLPPPALQARVMAHIATVRQLPPEATDGAVATVVRLRVPWYRSPVGLAASVLMLVSLSLGGVVAAQQQRLADERRATQTWAAIVGDPTRVVRSMPVAGGTATLVAAGGRAVFTAQDLPALPGNRSYQLWVVGKDKTVRSVGLLTPHGGQAQSLVPRFGSAVGLAVSVEPSGGSKQPTTKPIVTIAAA